MRVRVATLNLWVLPEPFAEDVRARLRAIGERLSDIGAHVVAFQEVWAPEARRELIAAGRRAGFDHAWHRDVPLGSGGLLVLSRLPIRSAMFRRFTLRGQAQRIDQGDYYSGKGMIGLRLETPVGPLALITTHLHARYRQNASNRAYRVGQVVELAAQVRGIRDPVVLLGDFNLNDDDPEYRVLRGLTGLRDVAAELGSREPTVHNTNAYRSDQREKRIDYVFTRDGAASRVESLRIDRVFDEQFSLKRRSISYSNHAGLLAELELLPRDAVALPLPDAGAVATAEQLLADGRSAAERRRRDGRVLTGAAVACAGLASLGCRSTRRELVRSGLRAAGLLALAPGLGFSLVSEVFVPDELRAFDRVAAHLAHVKRGRGGPDLA